MYKKENAPLPLHSDLCDSFGTLEVDFSHWQPNSCACEGGGGGGVIFSRDRSLVPRNK